MLDYVNGIIRQQKKRQHSATLYYNVLAQKNKIHS